MANGNGRAIFYGSDADCPDAERCLPDDAGTLRSALRPVSHPAVTSLFLKKKLPAMLLKHAGFTMQVTHVAYVWNAIVLV